MKKLLQKFKPKPGVTLVELVVALAILGIVLVSLSSIFALTYKSIDKSTSGADAQNLAVLAMEKIQNEVRNGSGIEILNYDETNDILSSSTLKDPTLFYYEKNQSCFVNGKDSSSTYLAGSFKKYYCKLTFNPSPGQSKLLVVTVEIRDKNIADENKNTIYSTSTNIYVPHGTISGSENGNAIAISNSAMP